MLTLEPVNGLCNRMRAIDSALALARANGVAMRVVWVRQPDCGAAFGELFQPVADLEVVERSRWGNRVLRRLEIAAGRYRCVVRHDEMRSLLRLAFDFDRLLRERESFVQSFHRFHPSPRPFADFAPAAPLAAEIERIAGAFPGRTVGVHVRRGDNVLAAHHSPTAAYLERMAAALADDPETHFFLATDSPAAEDEIRRSFPGRVLTRPRTWGRDSTAALRDAVVDLWCLARTRAVLGSYFSSFSETAAEIGGLPLTVVDVGEEGAAAPALAG